MGILKWTPKRNNILFCGRGLSFSCPYGVTILKKPLSPFTFFSAQYPKRYQEHFHCKAFEAEPRENDGTIKRYQNRLFNRYISFTFSRTEHGKISLHPNKLLPQVVYGINTYISTLDVYSAIKPCAEFQRTVTVFYATVVQATLPQL